MFDFLKNISSTEFIVILLILMALFGAKIMYSLARTSGGVVKELKQVKKEFLNAVEDDDSKPKAD